jgi:hypothetical protein
MANRQIQRSDTAANWASVNPVVSRGEFGYEFDTGKLKMGDGTTAWNALAYYTLHPSVSYTELGYLDGVTSAIQTQINSKSNRNHLINGDFSIAQRGISFTGGTTNADDVYTLDRWYILSDGNDTVDVTQNTASAPTNQLTCIALDVETINKKFGIAQIIEQKNCVGLIGNTVTLSFKAKVSATTKLDNVKAAIVAWSGTADTVTSDIISAWGIEGTNPTLIANATYENTPANLNVTTSYATYSITANIDTAITKNVVVVIWSDVTDTTLGDFLYITDVQLEVGDKATNYERRSFGEELALCQRYYEKSYEYGTVPGTNTSTGEMYFTGTTNKSNNIIFITFLKQQKFSTSGAVITFYARDGTAGVWNYDRSGVTPPVTSTVLVNALSGYCLSVYLSIGAALAPAVILCHFTISCEL